MTNVIILFMAVGLLVAAIRATSSTPERVIFALLGAAGIGFVGWAQVTGFVLPPITLNANWPLVAAVLTFALIGTGISTGSTRWSALGVISFTWLAWLLLSFSWIALALVAAGILLALMFSTLGVLLAVMLALVFSLSLRRYAGLAPSPLEHWEALEQLRALWHGFRISVAITDHLPSAGVDTPDDARRMQEWFKKV